MDEWITSEQIRQALRSLSPPDFRREYDAEFPRSPRRLTLLLAGTAHQAALWKRMHQLGDGYRYISQESHIRGYSPENVDLIRVGEWWLNPLTESRWFTWQFPNWRESPIEDLYIASNPGEVLTIEGESDRPEPEPAPRRLNGELRFTFRLSDEARERVRQAFEQAQIATQCMSPELLEQFEQAARRIPEGFARVAPSRFSIAPPRHGKQQQIDRHKWCAENGYTDPFVNEGEWWAFPPGGVMPLRLRDVMYQ